MTKTKSKKSKLTLSEKHTLDHFLSDYPTNLTFDEILEKIENGTDFEYNIVIWEPFENYDPCDIIGKIENLKDNFECYKIELIKEIEKL